MRHLLLIVVLTSSAAAARPPRALKMKSVGRLDVAAASGLVVERRGLRVVADDLTTLTSASRRGRTMARRALVSDVLPTETKALKGAKPDFEALARIPESGMLTVGSGSTTARDRAVLVEGGGRVKSVSLAPLYDHLRITFAGELNIEGAAVQADVLALATRRSGSAGDNRLVLLDLARVRRALRTQSPRLGPDLIRGIVPVALGSLRGVPLGLTDLTPHGDGFLASAAAEKTDDPVEDGVCVGSCLVKLDAAGNILGKVPVAPRGIKIEGLGTRGHTVVAVTDADDPTRMSPVLEARLPKSLR